MVAAAPNELRYRFMVFSFRLPVSAGRLE